MTLPIFLELVEMKAKTASVLPFLIGLCFSAYYYNSVHPVYVGLFFVAMFLFNMFVDIWNITMIIGMLWIWIIRMTLTLLVVRTYPYAK